MRLLLLLTLVASAFAAAFITTRRVRSRIESPEGTVRSWTESAKGTIQPRTESRKGVVKSRRQSHNGTIQPMEESTKSGYTCYKCSTGIECSTPYNKTCDGGLHCFTNVEIIEGNKLLETKGCLTDPFDNIIHCVVKYAWNENQTTSCCQGDLCNIGELTNYPLWDPKWSTEMTNNIEVQLDEKKMQTEETFSTHTGFLFPLIFGLPVALVSFIGFLVIYVAYKKPNLLRCCRKPTLNDASNIPGASGSKSGSAISQRCFAQDITLLRCIGEGRYGKVWESTWHGENVAVKIFSEEEEESWKNEVNIYTKISLNHENVLRFKGSLTTTRLGDPEMWLITAFHEQGSLYDYLSENTIDYDEMVKFARSTCAGLLHLHTDVVGSKGKPAIAHRDMKTRNILLTSDGTCVIADFGLAIVNSRFRPPVNFRVGTKRYMAPEILDQSIKTCSFESFKRADMYSFGLVLWEICSRCTSEDVPYCPPFGDCVPSNPDFEDMKKVVCDDLKRPEIPDSWSSDQVLDAMATLMKECWHRKPEARCSVLRVKKCLDRWLRESRELQSTVQGTWL